jgi:hypothetical protein
VKSVAWLTDCAGTWIGSNGFRLMPADALAMRPASATLSLAANTHVASLAYQWEHPDDGPQDGLVVFGQGADVDSIVAFWGDSWHQQPEVRVLNGRIADEAVQLICEYGGGWQWRILIAAEPPGLRMQMENVIPLDEANAEKLAGPYEVMRMELHEPSLRS